jgi:outer membrane protein TolC
MVSQGCATPGSGTWSNGAGVTRAASAASQAISASEPIAFSSSAGPLDVEDPPPDTLTLSEAIRRALKTSPELQAALARVRGAQAEVDQAKLFPNPILSVSVRFPANGKSIIDAGLSEDLLYFLTRSGRISAADNRLRGASAEAVTAALDLLSEVQQRYAGAQAADELVPVLEQRSALLNRLRSLAEDRLRAGEGTRLDVTTLDAQRVELDVEFVEQKLQRSQERLALSRLIGNPSGNMNWHLTRWEPIAPVGGSEDEWVRTALEHRPELVVSRSELAALGVEMRLSPLGILEGLEAGVDSERDSDWSVGPSISTPLPIFDWGQAKRDASFARVVQSRHQFTQSQRKAVEEVRRAYEGFAASHDALRMVRDELIPLQERRREQAESAYKLGQTDVTSLVLAEQELQSARIRLIELQRRTSEALIGLQRSVGGAGVAASLATRPSPATSPRSGPSTRPAY